MKGSTIKIIALVTVIAVPAFFLLLFRPLSKVPRPHPPHKLYPTGEVNAYKDEKGKQVYDSFYHEIPNQVFTSHEGEKFELDSLRGQVYVADFFFATCPGICPVMTKQLERVQNAFIKDHNFKILSFTVDPAKDTLSALREYARNNNAIPGKWYFLRTEKEDIFKLAKDGFFLVAKDNPGQAESFLHSEKLTLVDAEGNIRGYYNGVDSNSVNKMMGDIVLLLRDLEKNYSFRKDPKKRGSLFSK